MGTTIAIPPQAAATLSNEEILRYSRHLIMPEVGMEGQLKLKQARVLCIGAGGLGSPLALYLGAAGVGTLGIVDFDVVDYTNLQRQIIHSTADVGRKKLDSAADKLKAINPFVEHAQDRDSALRAKTRSSFSAISTSSPTARTTFPPAIWSMTPACSPASPMFTDRFSASRGRPVFSPRGRARATAACIPSRRRRGWCLPAPRAACWASCRDWWA